MKASFGARSFFPSQIDPVCFSLSISVSKEGMHSNLLLVLCAALLVSGMASFILFHQVSQLQPCLSSVIYHFCFSLRIPDIFLYAVKIIILGHIFQRTVFFVTWAAILTNHLRELFVVSEQLLLVPFSNAACTPSHFFFY